MSETQPTTRPDVILGDRTLRFNHETRAYEQIAQPSYVNDAVEHPESALADELTVTSTDTSVMSTLDTQGWSDETVSAGEVPTSESEPESYSTGEASLGRKLGKFAKRHRVKLGALAAAGVVLFSGTVYLGDTAYSKLTEQDTIQDVGDLIGVIGDTSGYVKDIKNTVNGGL